MPEPSVLAAFFAAAFLLAVVPGPAVLYIVARSFEGGRAAGLASAAGVGGLVHVVGATAGLSALLASSAAAFTVVKYLGAAYLIGLGLRTLLRPDRGTVDGSAPRSLRALFVHGVVVQALNPKVAVFFLAFLPQFASPGRGSVTAQLLLLGTLFVATALITDGAYALLAGRAGGWVRRSSRVQRARRYVPGVTYLTLGAAAFAGADRK